MLRDREDELPAAVAGERGNDKAFALPPEPRQKPLDRTGALGRFEYLHYGLAVVLGVVGLKMLTSEVYDPPIWMTLGSVVLILGASILASLWATRSRARVESTDPRPS